LTTLPVQISIIIVNWNGTSDTVECLTSIASAKNDNVALTVIVVDNGSETDPTNQIMSAHPQVTLVRLDRNIGFAGACNVGIKEAIAKAADCILLLNNDTVVERGLFEKLVRPFAEDGKTGIVAPLIYSVDRRNVDFAGAKITFALGKFEHVRHEPEKKEGSYETEYVSGCCMMLPRVVVEQIGLLDEKLFAYFEDVDLCLRARQAGFRLTCLPGATVLHKGSASTRRALTEGTTSPLKHYLVARNRTIIVRRYAPAPAKWFYLIVSNPLRACFYLAAFFVRGRWSKLRWFWRGIVDGVAGKLEMPEELGR
jgi:GT2 family glycosyltransferase